MNDLQAPEWLRPGAVVRFAWSRGNSNNRLVHIRTIVDGNWVVSRSWSRRSQSWHYSIDDLEWYAMCAADGHATFVRFEKEV